MKRLTLLSVLVILLLAVGVRAQKLEIVTTGTVTLTGKTTRVTGGHIDSALVRLNMRKFIPQLVIEVDTVGTDFNEVTAEGARLFADSIHTLRIAKQHTVLRHILQVEFQMDTTVSGVDSLDNVGRAIIVEIRQVSSSTKFTGVNASNLKAIGPWIAAQFVNATVLDTIVSWSNRDVVSRQFIVPVGRDLQMRIRTTSSDTVSRAKATGNLIVRYVVTAPKK